MIISDLNHMEVISRSISIEGGTYTYYQNDYVGINFNSNNSFYTNVNSPKTYSNSAAAGAKADAINPTEGKPYYVPTYSFTKADTLAVTALGGSSFSASTSAAVINPIFH
ncbi:hypothetical protein IFO70_22295 [Phormidium tenue FACHB-886]|nr:hypothetical protein [Phormidium tenue FACHB-886]